MNFSSRLSKSFTSSPTSYLEISDAKALMLSSLEVVMPTVNSPKPSVMKPGKCL